MLTVKPLWIARGVAEDTGLARLLDRLLARELRVVVHLLRLTGPRHGVRDFSVPVLPSSSAMRLVPPSSCRRPRPGDPACSGAVVLVTSLYELMLDGSSSEEVDVGRAGVLDRDLLEQRPEAEVHGERAGEVRERAALERREQRHRVAARPRDRRDEERRLAGAHAESSRPPGSGSSWCAATRARQRRWPFDDHLAGHAVAEVEHEVVAARRDEREVRGRRLLDRQLDAGRGADPVVRALLLLAHARRAPRVSATMPNARPPNAIQS